MGGDKRRKEISRWEEITGEKEAPSQVVCNYCSDVGRCLDCLITAH